MYLQGAGTALGELPPYFMARAGNLASLHIHGFGSCNMKPSNGGHSPDTYMALAETRPAQRATG